MKYLKGTKNLGILFSGSSSDLLGYSDSDFGGCSETRKSRTGFVFMLNGGVISWKSQKQKCVSLSTTEAEFIAASEAVQELIWLKNLLAELTNSKVETPLLFIDNQSTIKVVKNPEYHGRMKHVDIRYHFVKEKYEAGLVKVEYVCSEDQLADIFTKALSGKQFEKLRTLLSLFERSKIEFSDVEIMCSCYSSG